MTTAAVVALGASDLRAVARLLDREPISNVYLRSELRHSVMQGPWLGVAAGSELVAVARGGALLVPAAGAHPADVATLVAALPLPQTIVGPRTSVLAALAELRPRQTPRRLRERQPELVLERSGLTAGPGGAPLRPATRADLESVVIASAVMHHEECGDDPLQRDPSGWRERVCDLIDRGWSWVWIERGQIIFKAELSALTHDAAQIQGVWVAPGERGRGTGERGMRTLLEMLLPRVGTCSLYVNQENLAARRLYARLGFRHHSDFATAIF